MRRNYLFHLHIQLFNKQMKMHRNEDWNKRGIMPVCRENCKKRSALQTDTQNVKCKTLAPV